MNTYKSTGSNSGDYAIVGASQEDNSSTSVNNTDNATITDTAGATSESGAVI